MAMYVAGYMANTGQIKLLGVGSDANHPDAAPSASACLYYLGVHVPVAQASSVNFTNHDYMGATLSSYPNDIFPANASMVYAPPSAVTLLPVPAGGGTGAQHHLCLHRTTQQHERSLQLPGRFHLAHDGRPIDRG